MKKALTIAGYDSNGSAGLAADLHSFFADQVYGMGVLTSAVAEDNRHITAAHNLPTSFIEEQFNDMSKFNIQACKTGMLSNSSIIQVVINALKKGHFGPLVIDPVIVTKLHDRLLDDEAFNIFINQLIPLATVITPNFVEAEELSGHEFTSDNDVINGAHRLQKMGAKNVVIKGNHSNPNIAEVRNFVLLENGEEIWIRNPYIPTNKLNGAGDTFSAIITAELAKGNPVKQAIHFANNSVEIALKHSLTLTNNFGPINHWQIEDFLKR